MIARPKMSQHEWKTTEIRASKVGHFSPFSCPGVRLRMVAPIEGWVSEKVLEPFKFQKRWRTSQAVLDCRHVIEVRYAGKKGMAVYARRPIPSRALWRKLVPVGSLFPPHSPYLYSLVTRGERAWSGQWSGRHSERTVTRIGRAGPERKLRP